MSKRYIGSERVAMAPAEIAALERRVARAYRDGVDLGDMRRRFDMSWEKITGIARKYGVPLRMPHNARRRKTACLRDPSAGGFGPQAEADASLRRRQA